MIKQVKNLVNGQWIKSNKNILIPHALTENPIFM